MDRWKDELKAAFEAPAPCKKRQFLRKIEPSGISIFEFLISQLRYIRKWIWIVSFLIFTVSLMGSVFFPAEMLWVISALTPLLALIVVAESGRSEYYMMTELELAARFSLRSVLLARLTILGLDNAVLFCFLIPIGLRNNIVSPTQGGLCIITPFLLTALIGLSIVRRFRGRESVYLCTGVSIIISFAVLFTHASIPQIYDGAYLIWWITGAAAFCIGALKQYGTMIRNMEELIWSFS